MRWRTMNRLNESLATRCSSLDAPDRWLDADLLFNVGSDRLIQTQASHLPARKRIHPGDTVHPVVRLGRSEQ
jgi:hypothetical protein